ncbi:MAG: energy transducer TonB [Gemmatimonadota bacterium]
MNRAALTLVAGLALASAGSASAAAQCPSPPEIFGKDAVLLSCQVTKPVEWNYPLRLPKYPFGVKDPTAEGNVLLSFIVDTAGQIEPATIRVLRTTNDMYSIAARTAIGNWRGKPARMDATPVRVYVQQEFLFRIRAAASCEWTGAREAPAGLLACR